MVLKFKRSFPRIHSQTQNIIVICFECFLLFITFSTCSTFFTNNKVWRTCFIESSELVAGSDIRKEEFEAESLIECNFIANENKWSFLMCYKDQNCSISDQLFPPSFEPLGLTNPVKCFTALEKPRPKLAKNNFIVERSMKWQDALKNCESNKATFFVPKTKAEYEFMKSFISYQDRNIWYPMVYYPDIDKVIYLDGTEMEDNPFNPPKEDYDPPEPEKSKDKACSFISYYKTFLWNSCSAFLDNPTLICKRK